MNALFLFLATQPSHLKYFINNKSINKFHVTVKDYLRVLILNYTTFAVIRKMGPIKPVKHTGLVAVVTSTDRP